MSSCDPIFSLTQLSGIALGVTISMVVTALTKLVQFLF
jgi:hypothetical protein